MFGSQLLLGLVAVLNFDQHQASTIEFCVHEAVLFSEIDAETVAQIVSHHIPALVIPHP